MYYYMYIYIGIYDILYHIFVIIFYYYFVDNIFVTNNYIITIYLISKIINIF